MALLVVLASSAVVMAWAASAAVVFSLAEWLEGGSDVTATLSSLSGGELLLENRNAPIVKKPAAVSCSGSLDGSVGPDGADKIAELLINH